MSHRQPLAARVWGGHHRTWFASDNAKQKGKAKRRAAKRERQQIKNQIRKGPS